MAAAAPRTGQRPALRGRQRTRHHIRDAFELVAARVERLTGRRVPVTTADPAAPSVGRFEQRHFVARSVAVFRRHRMAAVVEPDRRHRSHHRGVHVSIVVTGALGHIGSRLIRDLAVAWPGTEIVMLDNLATERYASLYNLPAACRYEFVEGDVLTADLIGVFAGADAVVHLAALTNSARAGSSRVGWNASTWMAPSGSRARARRWASGCCFPSTTSVYGVPHGVVTEDCAARRSAAAEPVCRMEVAVGGAAQIARPARRVCGS